MHRAHTRTQQGSGEYTEEYGHYCTVVFNKEDGLSIRENVRDTRSETTVLRTLSRTWRPEIGVYEHHPA